MFPKTLIIFCWPICFTATSLWASIMTYDIELYLSCPILFDCVNFDVFKRNYKRIQYVNCCLMNSFLSSPKWWSRWKSCWENFFFSDWFGREKGTDGLFAYIMEVAKMDNFWLICTPKIGLFNGFNGFTHPKLDFLISPPFLNFVEKESRKRSEIEHKLNSVGYP